MALAAVADDGDLLAGQGLGIGVGVVVHLCGHRLTAPRWTGTPGHNHGTGADELLYAKTAQEGIRASTSASVPVASTMSDRRPDPRPGLVHLGNCQHLTAVALVGPDLDERYLVLDRRVAGDILNLEHVDEPVELLGRCSTSTSSPWSVMVMRLTSGWSV